MTNATVERATATDPACHVVQIAQKRREAQKVDCAGLPNPARISLMRAIQEGRKPKATVRRVEELRRREGLTGVALCYRAKKKSPIVPSPLTVPFEPFELDECRAPLGDLIDAQVESADQAKLRSSRVKRFMVRLGLPAVVILPQLSYAILQVAIHREPFVIWLWGGIIGSLVLWAFLRWWYSDQWLLTPGAVVVRRAVVGRMGRTLRRYTPADTVLIVRPSHSAWQLELWQGEQVKKRQATDLECAALLAAWQSPLPPPELERMSDLVQA